MRTTAVRLLFAALAASAAIPAAADSYFFRSKPLVSPPRPFSFGTAAAPTPGAAVESGIVAVAGHPGRTATLSAPAGSAFQICARADCSDQAGAWRTDAARVASDPAYARLRVPAAGFGGTATATLSVGETAGTFEVETRARDSAPDAFSFTPVSNVPVGETRTSGIVRLENHDGVTVSVSGHASARYQVCSAADCSDQTAWRSAPTADVVAGTWARVRVTPAATAEIAEATLRAGETIGTFTATATAKDTTPDTFQFTAVNNGIPTTHTSGIVQLRGHDGVTVSVKAGSHASTTYQICSTSNCSSASPFTNAPTVDVPANAYLRVRMALTQWNAPASATIVAGNTEGTFAVTTRVKDVEPKLVEFASVPDAKPATETLSQAVLLTEHDGVPVSVSGTGATLRVCSQSTCGDQGSGGWATSFANVANGSYVQMKVLSGAGNETRTATLAYGSRTATWSVTALPGPSQTRPDCTKLTTRAEGYGTIEKVLKMEPGFMCIGNTRNPSPNDNFVVVQKTASGLYWLAGTQSRLGGFVPFQSVELGPYNHSATTGALYYYCSVIPSNLRGSLASFPNAGSGYKACYAEATGKAADGLTYAIGMAGMLTSDTLVNDQGKIMTVESYEEFVRY